MKRFEKLEEDVSERIVVVNDIITRTWHCQVYLLAAVAVYSKRSQ